MLNYQLMNSVCLLAKFMCLSAILFSVAPLFVSILMNILFIKTISSIIIEKCRYALFGVSILIQNFHTTKTGIYDRLR